MAASHPRTLTPSYSGILAATLETQFTIPELLVLSSASFICTYVNVIIFNLIFGFLYIMDF